MQGLVHFAKEAAASGDLGPLVGEIPAAAPPEPDPRPARLTVDRYMPGRFAGVTYAIPDGVQTGDYIGVYDEDETDLVGGYSGFEFVDEGPPEDTVRVEIPGDVTKPQVRGVGVGVRVGVRDGVRVGLGSGLGSGLRRVRGPG